MKNDNPTKVICSIIPARGGSKSIPRKNLRHLNGKPLIYYSIRESLQSRFIDRTFVSTEDDEIAVVSEHYGAEIIRRPPTMAKDDSPTIDAALHVLESLNTLGIGVGLVVLLQPTSPLRTAYDIDNAIKMFKQSNGDSLISVCEISPSPYWCFTINDHWLKPLFGDNYLNTRRQDLPRAYAPNGAIYAITPEALQKYHGFYGRKTIPYIMPGERSIDIDEEIDFKIAEQLLCG